MSAVFSAAETVPGVGGIEWGDYNLQLDFWPFNHKPPETVLRRQGVPFWDYLDAKRIDSVFYDLPSNYPPSPSQYGHHKCVCGMGTPDMMGSYGTYQYFSEDTPTRGVEEGGGLRSRLRFDRDFAKGRLRGPPDAMKKTAPPIEIEFDVYRDKTSHCAVIEMQGQKIMLRRGQWSPGFAGLRRFDSGADSRSACERHLSNVSAGCRSDVSTLHHTDQH